MRDQSSLHPARSTKNPPRVCRYGFAVETRRSAAPADVAQSVVDDREAHLVLLFGDDVGEGGREPLDVIQLGLTGGAGEVHRAAGVEDEGAEEVRLVLEQADVSPARARQNLPVQPPQ